MTIVLPVILNPQFLKTFRLVRFQSGNGLNKMLFNFCVFVTVQNLFFHLERAVGWVFRGYCGVSGCLWVIMMLVGFGDPRVIVRVSAGLGLL